MLRDEYIGTIKTARFQEVTVLDETIFSMECLPNDPSAQTIIKDLKISPEELQNTAESVVSIKISAVKSI